MIYNHIATELGSGTGGDIATVALFIPLEYILFALCHSITNRSQVRNYAHTTRLCNIYY